MTRPGATAQQRTLIGACLDAGVAFFWRSRGTLLIQKSDLMIVVPKVVDAGETVLGFEGFELDGSDVSPRLDLIADLERGGAGPNSLEAISGWPEDVWVGVALGSGATTDTTRATDLP